MNPWFPDDIIEDPPNVKESSELYAQNQQWKYLKRNKKKYTDRIKKAKACGLDHSKDSIKWNEWNNRLKTFNKSIDRSKIHV